MKKSAYLLTFTVCVFVLFAFVNKEKPVVDNFKVSFADVLTHAKEYTIEVAKDMPEDKYTFKPSDSVRSFGEQMAHIGMSTDMMVKMFIKGEKVDMDPAKGAKMEKKIGQSKEACIKLLNKSFDEAIHTLSAMDEAKLNETFVFFFSPDKPEFTKKEGFELIRDHITHHRGQSIIYLRMQGKKAPNYRAF